MYVYICSCNLLKRNFSSNTTRDSKETISFRHNFQNRRDTFLNDQKENKF